MSLRRRIPVLLVPVLLLGTACGGGGGDDESDALAASPAKQDVPLARAPAAVVPDAVADAVPEAKMTNVVTGEASSPRAYIGQDKPVLYWFWAPH